MKILKSEEGRILAWRQDLEDLLVPQGFKVVEVETQEEKAAKPAAVARKSTDGLNKRSERGNDNRSKGNRSRK